MAVFFNKKNNGFRTHVDMDIFSCLVYGTSLVTVSRELSNYRIDLVGMLEVK
jgi:hypothetical protein